MTPIEALAFLDQATGAALLNRGDHITAQKALALLKVIVEEHAMLKVAVNEVVESEQAAEAAAEKKEASRGK